MDSSTPMGEPQGQAHGHLKSKITRKFMDFAGEDDSEHRASNYLSIAIKSLDRNYTVKRACTERGNLLYEVNRNELALRVWLN